MKNPNGFGSVYKLLGNRKKKWIARKTVGWENGKQKRAIVGYYETKNDALKALASFEYNPNDSITIKEVYDMWSEKHYEKIGHHRKRNLISRYNAHIKKIEDQPLKNLTLDFLQEFFNNLKVGSGTLREIKILLKMIIQYALKNDFIQKSYLEYVELGKYKKVYKKTEFSKEEIEILWKNIHIPFVDSILILIYTGMRISEFLNLKINDVYIEEKIQYISIKESKTDAGIRDIPISKHILPIILKKMFCTKKYILEDKNKKLSYTKYKMIFKDILEKLGLPYHTPHECRHTTATILCNAGADPVAIAVLMGHVNYDVTKIYTHKNKDDLNRTISLM